MRMHGGSEGTRGPKGRRGQVGEERRGTKTRTRMGARMGLDGASGWGRGWAWKGHLDGGEARAMGRGCSSREHRTKPMPAAFARMAVLMPITSPNSLSRGPPLLPGLMAACGGTA